MTTYLVRRILALIPAMVVVVTIVFPLIHLIPGDPVSVMLGPDATPDQIEATRDALFPTLTYSDPVGGAGAAPAAFCRIPRG